MINRYLNEKKKRERLEQIVCEIAELVHAYRKGLIPESEVGYETCQTIEFYEREEK